MIHVWTLRGVAIVFGMDDMNMAMPPWLTHMMDLESVLSLFQGEWRYLLAGGMGDVKVANPDPSWISEKMWMEIKALSALPKFAGLASGFGTHLEGFKSIFDSSEPNRSVLYAWLICSLFRSFRSRCEMDFCAIFDLLKLIIFLELPIFRII